MVNKHLPYDFGREQLFFFILFIYMWQLLQKAVLVHVILPSSKAIHKQGSGSAGLKASHQTLANGSTVSSCVMFPCFLTMCVFCFYLSELQNFLLWKHGIWPSFHQSLFMNNWETLVFRNHKAPSSLDRVLGSVLQHGSRRRRGL